VESRAPAASALAEEPAAMAEQAGAAEQVSDNAQSRGHQAIALGRTIGTRRKSCVRARDSLSLDASRGLEANMAVHRKLDTVSVSKPSSAVL
jgi:hypothetical protein